VYKSNYNKTYKDSYLGLTEQVGLVLWVWNLGFLERTRKWNGSFIKNILRKWRNKWVSDWVVLVKFTLIVSTSSSKFAFDYGIKCYLLHSLYICHAW